MKNIKVGDKIKIRYGEMPDQDFPSAIYRVGCVHESCFYLSGVEWADRAYCERHNTSWIIYSSDVDKGRVKIIGSKDLKVKSTNITSGTKVSIWRHTYSHNYVCAVHRGENTSYYMINEYKFGRIKSGHTISVTDEERYTGDYDGELKKLVYDRSKSLKPRRRFTEMPIQAY